MTAFAISEIVTSSEMDDAFAIRRDVFCREQGVAEDIEIDGLDGACRHYLARADDVPVGTARVRPIGDDEVKIERVAVQKPWRGQGFGRALMERAIADAEAGGARRLVLNAQITAQEFYAALGFVAEGGVFDEAGIAHVRMVRRADTPHRNA